MRIKSGFISGLLLAACMQAGATEENTDNKKRPSKSEIAGTVYNEQNRKPLRDVTVTAYTAAKKEKMTTTDSNGTYTFDDLKPGVYKLVYEREGYRKVVREKVAIKSDEGQQMHVAMEEDEPDFQWLPGFHFAGSK